MDAIYSNMDGSKQCTSGTIFGVFFNGILNLFAATHHFFNSIIMDIKYRVYLVLMGLYNCDITNQYTWTT